MGSTSSLEEFNEIVKEFDQVICEDDRKHKEELVDLFRKECELTPRLRAIGKEVVSSLKPKLEVTSEQLILEILDRARVYYRAIWTSCSRDEKLVLVQLAQEGLVNPKAEVAVRQLMRKRLVVRDPVFRIMNLTFARFACTALPPSIVRKWEQQDGAIPWGTILLTVALGVAVFLFITQQAFFFKLGWLT
jgi:hypothetical protein